MLIEAAGFVSPPAGSSVMPLSGFKHTIDHKGARVPTPSDHANAVKVKPNKFMGGVSMRFVGFFVVGLASLFALSGTAAAGVSEAKTNFKKIYSVPPTAKFEESPFNGIYVLRNNGGVNLIDEAVTINGFGAGWEVREDMKTENFRHLSVQEAAAMQQVVRQNIKTDWLPTSPISSGEKSVVIISAPNCPVCQSMEKDLQKFGKSIGAKVFYVPTLLGKGSDEFTQAVMCASNADDVWKQSMTIRNNYPQTTQECQKSQWADMVLEHTFERVKGNLRNVRTPAVIRPDGSVIFGWGANLSLADIKKRFGI